MNNQIKSIYLFYHSQEKKLKQRKKQSKKGKSNKPMKGKDAVL